MVKVLNRFGRTPVLRPNWARPVTLDYAFKTDISTSRDGTEHRSALRQTGRAAVAYDVVLTQAGMAHLKADIADQQHVPFVVPLQWRSADLAANASAGQDFIVVTTPPFWLIAGTRVVLFNADTEEAAEVLSVAGSTVTLTGNLEAAFAAGDQVSFALSARLQDTARFRALTSNIWTGSVRFDGDPGVDLQPLPSVSPMVFEDREVWVEKPNWQEEPTLEFAQERDTVDAGIGRIAVSSPWQENRMMLTLGYSRTTASLAEEMIAFFLRHKGQRSSFWSPTWQQDVVPRTASTGTTLEVSGTEFRDAFENSNIYNVLYARFPDGSSQINRISSMALSGDAQNTVVTMVDSWSQQMTPDTVLSWCPLWRFAVDTLSVSWLTEEVAEAQLSFKALPNEAA